jgi:xylulokinase
MYFIGFDIGSSSIKAALVEAKSGKPLGVVNAPEKEMDMFAPENGWAEQSPEDWWKYVCQTSRKLIDHHGIQPGQIEGIGISYQMHGLVLLDRQGEIIRNSIIWCDSRAVSIGEQAFAELGNERCSERLLNSPGNFTASKLKWIKEHEPLNYSRVYKFMLPGDYIAFRLSGTMNTTISGLSEGIFWDFSKNGIAGWLMDYYGFDMSIIPEIVPTFSIQARVSKKGAEESGLKEGTPILYRAGDQPNNALSLNVFHPGEVAATGGTSGVMYAITEKLSVKESSRVNNFAHVNYTRENKFIGKLLCINGAGIQYRWLLNNLDVASYEEMNKLAGTVPIGADGVVILPFGNGAERMLNNKRLGTRIVNINLNNHNKAHLCRAALEGIAFSFVYGMEIMKSDGIAASVIRAGNDNLFRSEIFADTVASLIDQEIEIYNTTGAIGAARACLLHTQDLKIYGQQLMNNDYVMSYKPSADKSPYKQAYLKWKKELELNIKNN